MTQFLLPLGLLLNFKSFRSHFYRVSFHQGDEYSTINPGKSLKISDASKKSTTDLIAITILGELDKVVKHETAYLLKDVIVGKFMSRLLCKNPI